MRELTCAEARDMASDLIDGQLDQDGMASVKAHVQHCPTCPNLYRAMLAVTTWFMRQRSIEEEEV